MPTDPQTSEEGSFTPFIPGYEEEVARRKHAGVNRDAVVGTRPNNTGFVTAGDLIDALEQANTVLASLREALKVISARGCGIPGHSVAVGCGSNIVANKALNGEYVRFCPDCHGRGRTMNWQNPKLDDQGVMMYEPCGTCKAKGLIPADPSSSDTPAVKP